MILLIGHKKDSVVDFLQRKLHERNCAYLRCDIEEFPADPFAVEFNASQPELLLKGVQLSPEIISGVFSRWHWEVGSKHLEQVNNKAHHEFFLKETEHAFWPSLLITLEQSRWMNHPLSANTASMKLRQLVFAQKCGLGIPHTIVSSDRSKLLTFWRDNKGEVVTKAIFRGSLDTGDEEAHVLFTSVVEESHLLALRELNLPPILFQQKIHKQSEIRLVVVKEQCWACILNVENNSPIDWREDVSSLIKFRPVELPEEIRQKCVRVTSCLGLNYGVFDLLVNANGDYVFLEVNQQGIWSWMEELWGMPISNAIIDYLSNNDVIPSS